MELICHPSHPAWLLQPVFQQRPQQAALQPRPFTVLTNPSVCCSPPCYQCSSSTALWVYFCQHHHVVLTVLREHSLLCSIMVSLCTP